MSLVEHDSPLCQSGAWPPTAEDAVKEADWWASYAIDRIGSDGRMYDPRFAARLHAARAQLKPAITLADPSMDQIVTGDAEAAA